MAFGQQSGPPATARQMQQLVELLDAAGHSDFRDARGPLGLSQRQAAGKFTRDEADQMIARLEEDTEGGGIGGSGGGLPTSIATSSPAADRRAARREKLLADLPAEELAAELQRRGWVVMEP